MWSACGCEPEVLVWAWKVRTIVSKWRASGNVSVLKIDWTRGMRLAFLATPLFFARIKKFDRASEWTDRDVWEYNTGVLNEYRYDCQFSEKYIHVYVILQPSYLFNRKKTWGRCYIAFDWLYGMKKEYLCTIVKCRYIFKIITLPLLRIRIGILILKLNYNRHIQGLIVIALDLDRKFCFLLCLHYIKIELSLFFFFFW